MFANQKKQTHTAKSLTEDSLEARGSESSDRRSVAGAVAWNPEKDAAVRPSKPALSTAAQEALASITERASFHSTLNKHEESRSNKEEQKLVVGPQIHLKGEVSNCGTLVIEGHVDGSAKSQLVQIAEGGAFEGDLEVETAEISGNFQGTLSVSKHLNISSTGQVTGTIRYAEIHIDVGGQISGDVQVLSSDKVSFSKVVGD